MLDQEPLLKGDRSWRGNDEAVPMGESTRSDNICFIFASFLFFFLNFFFFFMVYGHNVCFDCKTKTKCHVYFFHIQDKNVAYNKFLVFAFSTPTIGLG